MIKAGATYRCRNRNYLASMLKNDNATFLAKVYYLGVCMCGLAYYSLDGTCTKIDFNIATIRTKDNFDVLQDLISFERATRILEELC